jgi:hypothetical protein
MFNGEHIYLPNILREIWLLNRISGWIFTIDYSDIQPTVPIKTINLFCTVSFYVLSHWAKNIPNFLFFLTAFFSVIIMKVARTASIETSKCVSCLIPGRGSAPENSISLTSWADSLADPDDFCPDPHLYFSFSLSIWYSLCMLPIMQQCYLIFPCSKKFIAVAGRLKIV